MIRFLSTTALILAMLTVAACADAPKSAGPATAPAASSASTAAPAADGGKVQIPAPKGVNESDPTIRSHSAATCRADCSRQDRMCGDSAGRGSASGSSLESLTSPSLFSATDNCRDQLRRCLDRCLTAR